MKLNIPAAMVLTTSLIGCAGYDAATATQPVVDNSTPVLAVENTATATYWIAPQTTPCQGVGPMQCLLVNEEIAGQASQWQLFYADIAGFELIPGQFQKVQLIKTEVANPPADASSIAYTLQAQLAQTPRHYLTNTQLIANRKWNLKSLTAAPEVNPQQLSEPAYISLSGDSFNGFTGCNRLFGKVDSLFEARDASNAMLKLGPAGMTMMTCADPLVNTIELQLQQALTNADAVHVQWPFLNLYQHDQLIAQFVAEDWD